MLKDKILSASGGGVDPIYVDDVFSTWLYTGNNSAQTINNGIDLAGKGGLVWCKVRNTTSSNFLFDTARGANALFSNLTNAQQSEPQGITSFNANGFTLGTNGGTNGSGNTFASWTFREEPKFFDVVTYAGNGVAGRNIPHNLGSVPGCIIVKALNSAGGWAVYHRSLGATRYVELNLTGAAGTYSGFWNNTEPTSTNFTLGSDGQVNISGLTYVAYLFAHDAGGFGATGNDNVISCGEVGAFGNTVNLGWEPQWLLFKRADGTSDWYIYDQMRGFAYTFNGNAELIANSSSAESTTGYFTPITNGFIKNLTGSYIYIAIRRPHKPPTSGTQVFTPITKTGSAPTASFSEIGFPFDAVFNSSVSGANAGGAYTNRLSSRLTGMGPTSSRALQTSSASEEVNYDWSRSSGFDFNVGGGWSDKFAWYFWRRAPGFFDQVCYTGTGNGQVINHNLGAVPELAIFKVRGGTGGADWVVRPPGTATDRFLLLNSTNAQSTASNWYSATSTQITFPTAYAGTASPPLTYVAYLFASLPGISQVGTYTGNGGSQTINCGFAAGARFFLVKRTDSTGDWWVYDSARGIVTAADWALRLNTNAFETSADAVGPTSVGIIVNQESTCNINVNAASYIFLAIA